MQVPLELLMAVVVVAFDGCLFDRPVHPLDLAVRPGMVWPCEAVLNPMVLAGAIEGVPTPAGCRP